MNLSDRPLPLLFLDVDGVLNVFNPMCAPDWVFEPSIISSRASGGYELNLSKEMGAALEALPVKIVWLTTWIKDWDFANPDIGGPLGWTTKDVAMRNHELHCFQLGFDTSVIHKVPNFNSMLHWKCAFMKTELSRPGPKVVWIDDEMPDFTNQLGDAEEWDPHNRCFCVETDPCVGLTKEDIDNISEFLND